MCMHPSVCTFKREYLRPFGQLQPNFISTVLGWGKGCIRFWARLDQNCGCHGKKIKKFFLAHLSQRLIGELIGYSWSGVRPSASSVVNNFKRLLLQNRLPDQCQILCGASLGRGNESLFAASGSHDQDGRQAHIW